MKTFTIKVLVVLVSACLFFPLGTVAQCIFSGELSECITRNTQQNFSISAPIPLGVGIDPDRCVTHKWKAEGGTILVNNGLGQFVSVGSEVCFTEDPTECGGDCATLFPSTDISTSSVRVRWDGSSRAVGKISVEVKLKRKITIPLGIFKIKIPISEVICYEERSGTLVPVLVTGISRSNTSCSSNGSATFTASVNNPDNCSNFFFEWFRNGSSVGTSSGPSFTISGLTFGQSHSIGVRTRSGSQVGTTVTQSFSAISPTPITINGQSTIQGGGSYSFNIPNTNITNVTWTIEPFSLFYTQYLSPFSNNSVVFSPPFNGQVLQVTLRAVGSTNCGVSFSIGKPITIEIDNIPRPGNPNPNIASQASKLSATDDSPINEEVDFRESLPEVATFHDEGIQVFPNPIQAGQVLTLAVPGLDINEASQLNVWNGNGKLVLSQRLQGNWMELSTSQLTPGVYSLQIVSGQELFSKRLVIMR